MDIILALGKIIGGLTYASSKQMSPLFYSETLPNALDCVKLKSSPFVLKIPILNQRRISIKSKISIYEKMIKYTNHEPYTW